MTENSKYFVLKKKAVPEVLLKVVEAKRLLDCNPGMTVQEAADQLGISRSSFYKYKEDIFPFHDEAKGKTYLSGADVDHDLLLCHRRLDLKISVCLRGFQWK